MISVHRNYWSCGSNKLEFNDIMVRGQHLNPPQYSLYRVRITLTWLAYIYTQETRDNIIVIIISENAMPKDITRRLLAVKRDSERGTWVLRKICWVFCIIKCFLSSLNDFVLNWRACGVLFKFDNIHGCLTRRAVMMTYLGRRVEESRRFHSARCRAKKNDVFYQKKGGQISVWI